MRNLFIVVGTVLILALATSAIPPQAPAGKNLSWAFPATIEKNEPPVPDADPWHRPGSSKTYTQMQIDDLANPPDWYPDEHGAVPDIVKSGAGDKGFACGSCHLMSGVGHPESSNIAGLNAAYIEDQMADFKSGDRKDNAMRMNSIAEAISAADVKAAADYFSALKPVSNVKVVEADMVPVSYLGPGRMRFAVNGGGMEPIGNRIIEVPTDVAAARTRDPHTQFTAYVPTGSVAKGKALAETGGDGKTLSCSICHGMGLTGVDNIPRLAGMHPIGLARQLYNFQTGASHGSAAQVMVQVVMNLNDEDILDLAAYAASLQP
jgi:cytochrome c553